MSVRIEMLLTATAMLWATQVLVWAAELDRAWQFFCAAIYLVLAAFTLFLLLTRRD